MEIMNQDYLVKMNEIEVEMYEKANRILESDETVWGSEEYWSAINAIRTITDYVLLLHYQMDKRHGSKFNNDNKKLH